MPSYNALSLIGDLHLAPLAGAGEDPTYFLDPINATSMTLSPGTVEKIERLGKGRANNGTALNVLTRVSEAATITVGNDELRAEILAMQLRGATTRTVVTGGAVSNEPVVVKLDRWVPLAFGHLSSATVTATASPGPTPAYTEGTHFTVNRRLGLIKFDSTAVSGPADAATVLVSYTKAGYTYNRVAGSTVLPSRYAVRYDCINQASGKNGLLYVPQGLISPDGNLDLITDAFASGNLIITPELVDGQTAAYYYDEDE